MIPLQRSGSRSQPGMMASKVCVVYVIVVVAIDKKLPLPYSILGTFY